VLAISGCRRPFWIVGIALIITIGLSRIMLGVHWPSDVLAGWGFGVFWVSIWFSEKFPSNGAIFPRRPLRIGD
jgi:undecaprenyl-diphosphatase